MNRFSVLQSLAAEPQPLSVIAAAAGVSENDAQEALGELVDEHIAIEEDDGFELSGPLSWFGSFGAAVAHFAPRNVLMQHDGESVTHLYVDDVRVKGRRPSGDPENETVAVFACGRTARQVHPAAASGTATCEACVHSAQQFAHR